MEKSFVEAYHFTINSDSDQEYEENGMRLIGLYSSKLQAQEAVARLMGKKGFRDWPGGFRIYESRLDDDVWTSGFFNPYEEPDWPKTEEEAEAQWRAENGLEPGQMSRRSP